VGRPREHDEATRTALLEATERLVSRDGAAALSVRAVAREAGTTTRAVYSVFGSKDGLLVDALARRAFEFLSTEISELEETDDPAADLVAVGVAAYRRLVLEHEGLYRIAFQRVVPGLAAGPELMTARQQAWDQLLGKVARLEAAGRLRGTTVEAAAISFNAMLEGLANAELRGDVLRVLPRGEEERAWQTALETVVRGFAKRSRPTRGPRSTRQRDSGRGTPPPSEHN
jgi:AcrR family transcriptional regulator